MLKQRRNGTRDEPRRSDLPGLPDHLQKGLSPRRGTAKSSSIIQGRLAVQMHTQISQSKVTAKARNSRAGRATQEPEGSNRRPKGSGHQHVSRGNSINERPSMLSHGKAGPCQDTTLTQPPAKGDPMALNCHSTDHCSSQRKVSNSVSKARRVMRLAASAQV